MMKCAFCGGGISRRSWHGNSHNKKIVWACVTGTKKGKKYCPPSKSISEKALKAAFVDSFNVMCTNNRDVVVDFLKTVEESISKTNLTKKIKSLNDEIYKIETKLGKLVELNIEEIINKETYEEKYTVASTELEKLKEELGHLDGAFEEQKELEKKMKSFRLAFDKNELLEEFDREIFENVIDKVIIGKVDEDGKENPYSVTFIFKTGMQLEGDCSTKKAKGIHNESNNIMYSHYGDDTCGVYCTTTKGYTLRSLNLRCLSSFGPSM